MDIYTTSQIIGWAMILFGSTPGTVQVTPNFPIAIPWTGCAIMRGHAAASPGFHSTYAKVNYWKGGSVLNSATTLFYPDGTYYAIITGLRAGVKYHITIDVVEVSRDQTQTLTNIRSIIGR